MSGLTEGEKLRRSITKTVRIITRDNIEVTQRGAQPYVRFKPDGSVARLNLPTIPEEPSQKFVDAVHGYTDHETAHVLFTNAKEMNSHAERSKKEGLDPKILHSFTNIFEDVRIEKAMADKFAGSAYNLRKSLVFVIEAIIEPMVKRALAEKDPARREREVIHSAFVPWVRALAGDFEAKYFMDQNKLWPYFDRIKKIFPDFQAQLNAMETTQDAADLAFKYLKLIKDASPPSAAGESGTDASGEEGDESEGAGKKSKSKSKRGDTEGEDQEGDGAEKGEEGGEDGDDKDGKGQSDGENEGGDKNGEASGSGEEEGDSGKGDMGDIEAHRDIMDAVKGLQDMDEMLANVIKSSISGEFKEGEYQEYTRDYDDISIYKGSYTRDMDTLEREIARVSATMQKDLQRIITARSLSVNVPGFRSGRLNTAALHRLENNDDRIFRRKQVNATKDVAVQLLVDCSGSMGGAKHKLAVQSAWAFCAVLDKLKIPNEVIGFTSKGGTAKMVEERNDFAREVGVTAGNVRYEPLYMPIFKDFSERYCLEQKRRMAAAYYTFHEHHQNYDGASVLVAGQRLLQQKAHRRLLIVFSDGQPWGAMNNYVLGPHLKKVIALLNKARVETIGIGIQDDSVSKYYPKSFRVDRLEELPARVIGELKNFLLY